jgi:hypothetical protein
MNLNMTLSVRYTILVDRKNGLFSPFLLLGVYGENNDLSVMPVAA